MHLRPSFQPVARPASRHTTRLAGLALAAGLLLPTPLHAADSTRCADTVDSHLASLPLAPDAVQSIRIIEKVNISDEYGPDILGVDAWVRLNACSGWLVINMTAKCYVRQSYTRGDCRVEGLPNY
ncbi:hypothetical protein [Pelagibius sp. 7325]|uniref:hypothetical protein n=1 Tax=Pelagibius sp. 7325 TaxID=3131994 RepID=UPI0030EE0C73